ncbi:hypothetical protein [Nocardia iowensis]|nr:hypothetical protein [Nocardia iowensis]
MTSGPEAVDPVPLPRTNCSFLVGWQLGPPPSTGSTYVADCRGVLAAAV